MKDLMQKKDVTHCASTITRKSNKYLEFIDNRKSMVSQAKMFNVIQREVVTKAMSDADNPMSAWLRYKPLTNIIVEEKFKNDHLTSLASKSSTIKASQRGGNPVKTQTSLEATEKDIQQKVLNSTTRHANVFGEQQLLSQITVPGRTITDETSDGKKNITFFTCGKWIPEKGEAHVYHFQNTFIGNDIMMDKYKKWNYDTEAKKYTSPKIYVDE